MPVLVGPHPLSYSKLPIPNIRSSGLYHLNGIALLIGRSKEQFCAEPCIALDEEIPTGLA